MIKAHDTQIISNSMIQAIVADEIKRQRSERERQMQAKIDDLEMQLVLRKQKDFKIYSRYIHEAERYYGYNPRHTIIGDIFWAIYGYILLAFYALFDAVGM